MYKYNQKLPKEVEKQLDDYIKRITKIKWFQPESLLDKTLIEKQAKLTLKCFGIEAELEYRQLKRPEDWYAARDAARDAAWTAADLLALNLEGYKKKYPEGNFINLIPLYEMGLWPLGIIDGKFVIAVPPSKNEFPDIN